MCMLELSIASPRLLQIYISFLSCLYGPLAHGARSRRVELLNEDARRRDTRRRRTATRDRGERGEGRDFSATRALRARAPRG